MRAGPADRASEVPRKPRRASIRSLRENSLSSSTVWGAAQGRSTPETEGDWWAARRPMSSMPTTQPKRSEKSSERIFGIGSRGCSPSSQRRTREVSVLTWWAPSCLALRFTCRASSPLDQPLRRNQEFSWSLGRLSVLSAAFSAFSGLSAPLVPMTSPLTGTPPSKTPQHPHASSACFYASLCPPTLVATRAFTRLRANRLPGGVRVPKVILRSPVGRQPSSKRHHSPPQRMNSFPSRRD